AASGPGPLSFSFRLRPGVPADIPALSRAYARSWRETYGAFAPAAFTEGMTEAAAARIFAESLGPNAFSYFLYVAEAEGSLVGFADGGRERGRPEGGEGELYALYLLRDFQGRGMGRALLGAALARLGAQGLHPGVAWVLEHNPSRKFYEAMGGTLGRDRKTLRVGDLPLTLVPYRWATKPL
ncbi:MAG TPA: GNAT family N-acetyltransferase, partial [bacterium]|nr:GNAT family N-acetyltransferase [bacterium]